MRTSPDGQVALLDWEDVSAVMVQGLFMMADSPVGSTDARAQADRLAEGCRRLP
jgi:hypothetical protein